MNIDLHYAGWLLLAGTAVCSILLGPLPVVCVAILIAAWGVAVHRLYLARYAILILSISLFLSLNAENQKPWLGLKDAEVLKVRTLRDSRAAGQGSLHFFTVTGLQDHRGNQGQARGAFLGWSRERLDLPWGTELYVSTEKPLDTESLSDLIIVRPRGDGGIIPEKFALRTQWRRLFLQRLKVLPPQAAVLLEALLFGSKQQLLSPMEEGFRQIGCSHLLALSGMHLAVIMTVGAGLLGLLFPGRTARFAVMLVLPWYLFLVGPSPALLRAGIMFSCSVLVHKSTRRLSTQVLLFQSFIFLLLVSPGFLSDRGFQYSFAALTGILILSPQIMTLLVRIMPYFLATGISAGISAYLGSLPVALLAFGATNPAGIAATLVLSPLIWLYLAGGIIFLLLPGISWIGGAARVFFWILYSAIQRCINLFSIVPVLSVSSPWTVVLASGVGLIIAVRLIYLCLHLTMPKIPHSGVEQ
ncbi:ComEC/Rec2 family competence protein [Marispirochaeta sp.]|uniref:ComEC/Rec2 family competence protein n=1 Tax=Marispirochaeta sp. TaxID=2038653 RepID=UPI0029C67104|nr:ComEC/Rec2 family competence protein [Marispirochaeta sp.]